MTRLYTIWPANWDSPATTSGAWSQEPRWFVLDVTDGLSAAHIVEGPVSRAEALRRETELRSVARSRARARQARPRIEH